MPHFSTLQNYYKFSTYANFCVIFCIFLVLGVYRNDNTNALNRKYMCFLSISHTYIHKRARARKKTAEDEAKIERRKIGIFSFFLYI